MLRSQWVVALLFVGARSLSLPKSPSSSPEARLSAKAEMLLPTNPDEACAGVSQACAIRNSWLRCAQLVATLPFVSRTTLRQARNVLRSALSTGRVIISSHATADKGGIRRYDETEILIELEIAAATGDVDHNRSSPGRFLAYGVGLVVAFEVIAPDIVVVTVFEQGG